MNDETKEELIEQYLLGNLSGDMLNEFKEKLASDEQFKREVDLQRAIIRNIKFAGRKEWALKLEGFHKEMDLSTIPETRPGKISTFNRFYEKKYLLVAAAMLIFIVLSTLTIISIKSSDTNRIFVAYYKPYVNLEQTTRTLPSTAVTERAEAFKAYDKGDYHQSIRLFKNVLEKGEDEVVLFYLGNACLSAGNATEAENIFKNYLSRYQEFTLEATWYLSLSYIKQGRLEEARPLLEKLVKQNGTYSKEASEILNKK